jgi:protein TorT
MKRRTFVPALFFAIIFIFTSFAGAQGWQDLIKPPKDGEFNPIPVTYVYPPVKAKASCQEELDSGKLVEGTFKRTEKATKPWKIGVLFPHLKDPFWLGCAYAVFEQAKRLGVETTLLAANGYNDLVGQLGQMDDLIAKKVDMILLAPISFEGNDESVAKAKAAGVPVINVINDQRSDDLLVKVDVSFWQLGNAAAKWAIADAQKRGLKELNAVVLPGPAGAGWVIGEVEGTQAASKTSPIPFNILTLKYGDSGKDQQFKLAEDVFTTFGKKIDYLFGCSVCSFSAALPMKEAGLADKVKIIGYDITPDTVEGINNGLIAAAANCLGADQYRIAMDFAVKYLEKRIKTEEIPHTIVPKFEILTKDNFQKYPFYVSLAPANYRPEFYYKP